MLDVAALCLILCTAATFTHTVLILVPAVTCQLTAGHCKLMFWRSAWHCMMAKQTMSVLTQFQDTDQASLRFFPQAKPISKPYSRLYYVHQLSSKLLQIASWSMCQIYQHMQCIIISSMRAVHTSECRMSGVQSSSCCKHLFTFFYFYVLMSWGPKGGQQTEYNT